MRIKSIGTKLALRITLVIIVAMGILGILNVYQQHKKFSTLFSEKTERVPNQLRIGLRRPMWDLNDQSIHDMVQTFLTDPDILLIRVSKEDGTVSSFFAKEPVSGELIDLRQTPLHEPHYPNAVTRQAEIIFRDELIGSITIIFSRRFIMAQVQEAFALAGIVSVVLIGIVALVLVALVKKNVSIPLDANVQIAQRIADGDVDVSMQLDPGSSEDEIGRLNTAFHQMMIYLQNMAHIATSISNGDLHQNVTPRSERDRLGTAFNRMTAYLNEVATVATAIAAGNFEQRFEPKTEQDVLGKTFHTMIVQLHKNFEKLDAQIRATQREITERKRTEKVQAALYNISEAAHTARNLEKLFPAIHRIVGELMPAKGFYVAFYDAAAGMISFPYYYEADYDRVITYAPRKFGKGLTEYVLRTEQPLVASSEVLEKLTQQEKIEPIIVGTSQAVYWVGVPLKVHEKTIGMLAVQSITETIKLGENEKNILMFVST